MRRRRLFSREKESDLCSMKFPKAFRASSRARVPITLLQMSEPNTTCSSYNSAYNTEGQTQKQLQLSIAQRGGGGKKPPQNSYNSAYNTEGDRGKPPQKQLQLSRQHKRKTKNSANSKEREGKKQEISIQHRERTKHSKKQRSSCD